MKNRSKFLALIVLASLSLFEDCTNSDPTIQQKSTGICYPTNITRATYSFKIAYNSDNRVASITHNAGWSPIETRVYIYDSKGNITSSSKQETVPPSYSPMYLYTYDSNNRLIEEVIKDSISIIGHFTYQYNSTGQLILLVYEYPAGTKTWFFEYPNTATRNPSRVGIQGEMTTYQLEYDNKPNPYKVMFPNLVSPSITWIAQAYAVDWVSITGNNIIKVITNSPGMSPVSTDYNYEYNTVGYPIASTMINEMTWTYDCK